MAGNTDTLARFYYSFSLTIFTVCYGAPNQDDKANEAIFGSLKQALGQQNLVLMGDFNYPDMCWKINTAAHVSSIKFLECA